MELTSAEKAKELVDRYNKFDFNTIVVSTQKEYAKLCALIAVDEIMKLPNLNYNHNKDKSQYDYWQEVKQEINNL